MDCMNLFEDLVFKGGAKGGKERKKLVIYVKSQHFTY